MIMGIYCPLSTAWRFRVYADSQNHGDTYSSGNSYLLFLGATPKIVFMVTNKTAPKGGAGEVVFEPGEDPVARYLELVYSPATFEQLKIARSIASESFRRKLGERCRAARGRIEVGTAAAAIGVHRNTLWNIERGDTLPNAFDLEVMARYYKTSSTTLLTGKATAAPDSLEYRPQLMREVLSAVLAELAAQQLQLQPEKVAQLVDLIYEYEVTQPTNSAEAGVKRTTTRFLRLVA